jgi:TMEM175 potassium channel family protein
VHRLLSAWPSYAAYLVSFATIGVIWIEHHGMMSAARYINRRFIERTLLFLLFVSVIPWPTALVAEHIREGGSAARAGPLVYAVTMMLMGLALTLSWRFLAAHEELVAETARAAVPAGGRRALLGSLAYLPAIVLAGFAPAISLIVDAAIAIYFAVSRTAVPGLIYKAELDKGA